MPQRVLVDDVLLVFLLGKLDGDEFDQFEDFVFGHPGQKF